MSDHSCWSSACLQPQCQKQRKVRAVEQRRRRRLGLEPLPRVGNWRLQGTTPTEIVRLQRDESAGPDACWPWTASLSSGYGHFRWEGRYLLAHRVAYEAVNGSIPDGLTIDHLCRTRACCNPAHLEAVTLAENLRRMTVHCAKERTHCRAGLHAYAEHARYMRNPDGTTRRVCGPCVAEKSRENCRRYRARKKARTAA